ncbi:hypothetical protein OUZ56_007931 [Daphnia magna]|uniref:Uncharacterized protein n=1 Tax=Daphnia magna TaxID=35525 RepID=A0ABR0ABK5_9CRUS|nr:hypothetical protein OUZ56_007931 [Daphnia magna]
MPSHLVLIESKQKRQKSTSVERDDPAHISHHQSFLDYEKEKEGATTNQDGGDYALHSRLARARTSRSAIVSRNDRPEFQRRMHRSHSFHTNKRATNIVPHDRGIKRLIKGYKVRKIICWRRVYKV